MSFCLDSCSGGGDGIKCGKGSRWSWFSIRRRADIAAEKCAGRSAHLDICIRFICGWELNGLRLLGVHQCWESHRGAAHRRHYLKDEAVAKILVAENGDNIAAVCVVV